MWLVERKQRGVDPPQVLTANMVPPSMRAIVSGVDVQLQETKPTYSNPELEMISKEIEELARERRALETEIAQKEADVRIKNGEVRSLQVGSKCDFFLNIVWLYMFPYFNAERIGHTDCNSKAARESTWRGTEATG